MVIAPIDVRTTIARYERAPGSAGFTLVEMMIVFVILLIIAVLGIPELRHMMIRARLTGAANETASHFVLGRMEAIKRGHPVVVVPNYDKVGLFGFVDTDDDLVADAGEVVLFDTRIPADTGQVGVYFVGPSGPIGTKAAPAQSIWGWTTVPGSAVPVAVFESDGSIRNDGGIRIGDRDEIPRNVFEIRVTPQATARVEVRKYLYGGSVPAGFYSGGAGLWDWY